MSYDYYVSRQVELSDIVARLTQAARDFERAKNRRDGEARQEAEKRMEEEAKNAVVKESHVSYLWFDALKQKAQSKRDEGSKKIFSDGGNAIQDAWKKSLTETDPSNKQQYRDFGKIWENFRFFPSVEDIVHLLESSFLLVVPFKLKKPYLSKDERDFYLLDNPLRREKVFQTPMVASTSWKGALRAAMVRNLVAWWRGIPEDEREQKAEEFAEKRFRLALLFGDEKGEEQGRISGLAQYLDNAGGEKAAGFYHRKVKEYFSIEDDKPMPHYRGRLYFFPTFFDQVGLEVINPHDRRTGVGARGPILMECVPAGARGELFLLYVPFRAVGQSEKDLRNEVANDLEAVAKGVQAMLTEYGFGAKTSSGFGTAKDQLASAGKLLIRAELPGVTAQAPAKPQPEPTTDLPRYLESPTRLQPDLRRADGSLKSEEEYQAHIESRGRKYSKKDKQLYEKAKCWWEREGQKIAQATPQEPELKPEPPLPETPPVTFHTLSELREVAQQVAEELRKGGKV